MFRLLATTKCKRQQIAILIISFFAYVAGIRNEANNMLPLQQQQQQQQTTIENSNYPSHPTNTNFRPSPIIDFTPADAAVPQQFKPTYIEPNPNGVGSNAVYAQKQEIENDNRRYTIEKAQAETVTYGNIAEKQFSFPNEQQQQYTPQHLTDKPIYTYRDPYTNENYHYTPTETHVKEIPPPPPTTTTVYTNNNYNNNGYKQQYQNNDNQEYLVQSSMIVGTQQHQTEQQPQKQPVNPYRPYMSLSADKDVYLKRPGFVYDEKTGYKHPNSFTDKKSEVIKDKISYDSHDYPPPSYSQQQTSNFLPTPVPATPKPKPTPPNSSIQPFRQDFKATSQPWIFGQQQKPPQLQYLQSSLQSTSLPNYANNIDNYLLNKQPSADYYRTEQPPPSSYLQKQQQPQLQLQYEYEYDTRPSSYQQQQQYDSRPSPPSLQHSQYPSYENVRPPPQSPPPSYFNTQQSQYPSYENVRPSSSPPSYLNVQQTQYPSYENVRPPPSPPPGRPSYNNYYDYQIGEVPPSSQEQSSQHFNYPYPRPPPSQYPYQGPYRPTPAPSQQQSGLATLVQYAPQFTSLLLNGVGGGGGSSNSPLGSLLGALTGGVGGGTTPQQSLSNLNRRPVNSQLIRALENIARNDDLQCVPKVLCQMIAGQTERGQLPAFITSPAITNFLAGFPAASPALIYGRAALLGLSGGEKSCLQTYVKCPKNEYEIIYYLNNHRGGFFKFFSEPEEQQQNVNHDATQQGATSLFSILAALTGTPAATTTTPRPTPKPQAPATDITSGIGNFFTQLLSDYMGGATVEYQRSFQARRKRSVDDKIKFEGESADVIRFEQQNHQEDVLKFHNRNMQNDQENHSETVKFQDEDYNAYIDTNQDHDEAEGEDFHDEEDEEDTQQGVEFQDDEEDDLEDTQGRILHTARGREKRIKFFPQTRKNPNENDKEQQLKNIIKKFNDINRQRKLKFPTESKKREYLKDSTDALREGKTLNDDVPYGQKFTNYVENSYEHFQRDSKKIKFVDDNSQEQSSNLYSYYLQKPKDQQTKLVFPERQGKILNHPYYAASYLEDYYQTQQHPEYERQQDDKFVVSDNQQPSRYSEFPSPSSTNIYNTHVNSQQSHSSFTSNTAVNNNIYVPSSPGLREPNNNHFLPTPPPLDDSDYPSSNSIYSNSVFNSNKQHSNFNSLTQREFYKAQGYTSPTSSSSSSSSAFHSSNVADSYKPQRYTSNSYTNTNNRYYRPSATAWSSSSHYTTTKRPYLTQTTKKSDDKNIYVTNSRGVTEYYLTPDGRKVYL